MAGSTISEATSDNVVASASRTPRLNNPRWDETASVAKAKAVDVASLAAREGVQMHGGIGMTDEHDIGLYMKRAAVLAELLGDLYYHRNRVASSAAISPWPCSR